MKEKFSFEFHGKSYELFPEMDGGVLDAVVRENRNVFFLGQGYDYDWDDLDDLDVELFFEKYGVCEVSADCVGALLADELVSRAEPLLSIPDSALREFSVNCLADNFLTNCPTMLVEGHVLGSAQDWLTRRYSVVTLQDEEGYDGPVFLMDFSEATFDVGSFISFGDWVELDEEVMSVARSLVRERLGV